MSIRADEICRRVLGDFPQAKLQKYARNLSGEVMRGAYDIINEVNWDFRKADSVLELHAPYSEETCIVTLDDPAVTPSAGVTVKWKDDYDDLVSDKLRNKIIFGSSYQYYIATVSSNTVIALGEDYNLTTDLTASYTLYADEYKMPTTCAYGSEISLIDSDNGDRLERINHLDADLSTLKRITFGTPRHYEYLYDATNDYHCVKFYPAPDARKYVLVHYFKKATEFISATDNGLIFVPEDFTSLLQERAKMLVYERMSDNRFVAAKAKNDALFSDLKAKYCSPPSKLSRIHRYPGNVDVGRRMRVKISSEIV